MIQYTVKVYFQTRTYGSFSQWVAFDFGERPVIIKKLHVDVSERKALGEIRSLRFNLTCDRYDHILKHLL